MPSFFVLVQLEQFLIANREEYLHYSALNYTLQQKQYNNRLTERLLELATEHGYIFGTDFSFVTVRDRIRCYYKSFVQSAKKRGILMGYAARKAGLLSEDDEDDIYH
jgi:predicted TIM-barrel fold metal-dependent hydrolase